MSLFTDAVFGLLGACPVLRQACHQITFCLELRRLTTLLTAWLVESSWNVMAHGDAREGKWRGNWRMEWVASTFNATSEHGVSSVTTADAHTSAASSRLNWRPRRFKWTRPFRRKTKSGFCACAFTFQTQSTIVFPVLPICDHCCLWKKDYNSLFMSIYHLFFLCYWVSLKTV